MNDLDNKNHDFSATRKKIKYYIPIPIMIGFIIMLLFLNDWYINTIFLENQLQTIKKVTNCYDLAVNGVRGGDGLMSNSMFYPFLNKENIVKLTEKITERRDQLCKKLMEIQEKIPFIEGKTIHFNWLNCEDLLDMKYEFPVRFHKLIDDAYYSSQCGRENNVN